MRALILALEHFVVRHILFVRCDLTHHEQQTSSKRAHYDEQCNDQTQEGGRVIQIRITI